MNYLIMRTVFQNILRRSQKTLITLLFGSYELYLNKSNLKIQTHIVYNFNKNVLIKVIETVKRYFMAYQIYILNKFQLSKYLVFSFYSILYSTISILSILSSSEFCSLERGSLS